MSLAVYAAIYVYFSFYPQSYPFTGSTRFYLSIFFLLYLIPTVKRLHDLDFSGWCYLLMLLPVISWIFLFYLLFKPGEPTANRFGPP